MCVCTPNKRTPWCGKPGCEKPSQSPPNTQSGEEALRKDVADVLDQFGFVVSSRRLYSASAEMNAEIVKATDSIVESVLSRSASIKKQHQALLASQHSNTKHNEETS